jgi:nitronate monooxygenase
MCGGSAGRPPNKTGDFVEKVRAVADFKGKLELLNRGQRWVVRKIGEQLGTIADERLRAFLKLMAEGHDINIGALEKALAAGML